MDNIWKKFDSAAQFSHIDIPETWETLEDFVEWYVVEAKMPLMVPYNARVMTSDDAVAICVFRKGHYQVELYLQYPNMYIRKHAHPRMEVITFKLGGGLLVPPNEMGLSTTWGDAAVKLMPGETHGGNMNMVMGAGFGLLAFQKWYNIDEMSSASVQWKGELQGPNQLKLISARKKNAYLSPTYADVTDDET